MNSEQLGLYGDLEQFKAKGKTPAEKDAKEILESKVEEFVDKHRADIKKIIETERELDMRKFGKLVEKFTENAVDADIPAVRNLLAKVLSEKGYKLSGAVIRAEIERKDSTRLEKKSNEAQEEIIRIPKLDSEVDEAEEIKAARKKLFGGVEQSQPNKDIL